MTAKRPLPLRRIVWQLPVLLALLGLCSCQTMAPRGASCPPTGAACPPGGPGAGAQMNDGAIGPDSAFLMGPGFAPVPLPQGIVTPWKPPGIAGPWPADEYIWDGGEHLPVIVDSNLQIKGLELEDTIVHFDTIDGRTIVEPSNRVVIYAPRFGAVRQVTTPLINQRDEGVVQVNLPVGPMLEEEDQGPATALQPVQPVGEIGTKLVSIERLSLPTGRAVNVLRPEELTNKLLPFEDFGVVRTGIIEQSEKARLAESIDAAIVWTHEQAVQVILDSKSAHVEIGDQRAQATFVVDTPNHPRLRVIKMASSIMARPGEIVDFTIRFDNIGDQMIGNVTLVDNLTTRLEYIEGSAKSSLEGAFSTQANAGESLLLRWEFTDPIKPNGGGVVRFQCRVR